MPITQDRWGNALSSDALERALASESWLPFVVSARFFDCKGQYTNPAVWQAYELPPDAIVQGDASHHDKLDEISGTLEIPIFADLVPPELAAINGPQQGFRVEVDLVWGPGPANHWPYFTGYVTSPARKWAAQDAIAPTIITVQATGVLQERTRALNLSATVIPLATVLEPDQTYPFKLPYMMAVCTWRTVAFVSGGSANGDVDFIPQAFATADFKDMLSMSPNLDFSSPYATSTYAITTQNGPPALQASVTWNGTGGPASETIVYAKFLGVDFWMVPRRLIYDSTNERYYFIVPVGNGSGTNSTGLVYGQVLPRNPWDNYATTIAALPAANQITPADSTGYDPNLLDTGQGEYVTVTKADGTEATYKISSVSAGVITLTANWAGIAVGDAIRLSTTELFPSWIESGTVSIANASRPTLPIEIYGSNSGAVSGSLYATGNLSAAITASQTSISVNTNGLNINTGNTILCDSELMYVSATSSPSGNPATLTVIRGIGDTVAAAHATSAGVFVAALRNMFQFNPQLGIAVPNCHHFYNSDGNANFFGLNAQLVAGPESGSTANQIENVVSNFLTGGNGASYWPNAMFASSDVVLDNVSGVYAKNFPIYATNGLDFLKNLKKNALKPNTYIRDFEDGKPHIKSYVQANVPDWTLPNAEDIEEETLPDPVTAVAVISTDADAQNVAAKWLSKTYNVSNSQYAVDGMTSNPATQNQVGVPAYFFFDIPDISPIQLIPLVDSIQVYGSGFLTVYIQQATPGGSPVNSTSPAPANYSAVVPGTNFLYMAGTTSPTTITSDQIARAMCSVLKGFYAGVPPSNYGVTPSESWWAQGVGKLQIVVRIDSDDSNQLPPIAAQVSEIVINVKKQTGWLAGFTDNPMLVPAAYQPADPSSEFGDVWVQSDTQRRESWRWAPTWWMQRSAAQYLPADLTKIVVTAGGTGNPTSGTTAALSTAGTALAIPQVTGGAVTYVQLAPGDSGRVTVPSVTFGGGGTGAAATAVLYPPARIQIIEMQGISLSDCRSMSEAAADEYLHQSRQYKVTGPYCPWARVGDTALVYAPDGKTFSDGSSSKMLMLFAKDDSLNGSWQPTFCDYSA